MHSLVVNFFGGHHGTEMPIRGINLPKGCKFKKSGIEDLVCEIL